MDKKKELSINLVAPIVVSTPQGIYKGKIIQISHTKISFSLEENVFFRTSRIEFALNGQDFYLSAVPIKREVINSHKFSYECEYSNIQETEKNKLRDIVYRLDRMTRE